MITFDRKDKIFNILSCLSFIVLFIIFFIQTDINAEVMEKRFFLMGDGEIHIKNIKTGKEAKVKLLNSDGQLDSYAFEKIDEVFDFPTSKKGENISPRLIFMLDYFSDKVAGGTTINLVSGYRSPEHNAKIREKGANVAKTSTHIDGLALDFYIEGIDGKRLWEIIRQYHCCGVGHYGGNIIHLDAGRPRFWDASTSKVHTGESDYNRRIYITTEYDRYKSGETIRLSFSSVSDFGFGIKRKIFLTDLDGEKEFAHAYINNYFDQECIMINDRKTSRFIYFNLPNNLKNGRYKIKLDFCNKPFQEMPSQVLSNQIEIIGE
jgi:uncharacterized protein YcbK (DUF882 family)